MSGRNWAFDLQNLFRSPQERTDSESLPAPVHCGRTARPSGATTQVHSLENLSGHVKSVGFQIIAKAATADDIDFSLFFGGETTSTLRS